MDRELNTLLDAIRSDYRRWSFLSNSAEPADSSIQKIRDQMVQEFCDSLAIKPGRKYIKITTEGRVWGFVVKSDLDKFKKGDILKAADWRTPALNKPRGNIIDGDFSWVRWTGPEYLK